MCRRDLADPTVKKERILRCQLEGLFVRFPSRRLRSKNRRKRDDLEGYWSRFHTCMGGGRGGDLQGERRRHPRFYESFPVLARGVDGCREAFVIETVLDASALVVSLCGCRGASRSERSCSRSSASRLPPSRGQRPRARRCWVWCGARRPSLMGRTASGWPSRITGFSEEPVGGCSNAQPRADVRRPSGITEARESGALGDGAVMFSPCTQSRRRRCE